MRILYLITRADLGGAQVHLLDVLEGFRAVCEPMVAVGEEGFLTERLRELDIPCFVIPTLVQPMSPVKDFQATSQVRTLIRRTKPSLIHAHTSKAGTIGRIAARLELTPSVFTAHTWCFAEGTSLKWRFVGTPIERLAGMVTSRIINVSEANRQLALSKRIGSAVKQITIHNGIPDTPLRASPGSEGPPAILCAARFVPQKNQALLVRFVAKMRAPANIWFAGDGPMRPEIEQLAKSLGLQDRVRFLGERHDVPELLSQAHVFALPTNWEGFPLTVLEAMRAGLPVIANDVGGIREAVRDGETGFLVRSGDETHFLECLEKLAIQPELRMRLGLAGRARYETNFTRELMLRRLWKTYEEVLIESTAKIAVYGRDISTDMKCSVAPPVRADVAQDARTSSQ